MTNTTNKLINNELMGEWRETTNESGSIFWYFELSNGRKGYGHVFPSLYSDQICWLIFIGPSAYSRNGTQPCVHKAKLVVEEHLKNYTKSHQCTIAIGSKGL